MPPDAFWKRKSHDIAYWFGVLNGAVNRRRTQPLRKGQEAIQITGWGIPMRAAETQNPAIPLYREHDCTAFTFRRRWKGVDAFPIRLRILGN